MGEPVSPNLFSAMDTQASVLSNFFKREIPSKLFKAKFHQEETSWAAWVAQWLRIRLPMQGTGVRALVQEDPTCHGATKPVCYN